MEINTSSDKSKLIGAVIVGALVGAGIALLFAPNKGSVTREKLMKSGEKLKGKLNKKLKKSFDPSVQNSKRPPLL